MTMADRIAILDKGQVMQVATPAEIYEAPNSRFVADFIGSINLFEGTVEARDGETARIAADGVAISTQNAADAASGDRVWFAIRPEKIRVSSKPPANGANAAEGEIYDIAYLGDMTVYHVKLANGRVVKATTMNSVRVMDEPLTWNDKAWIAFAPDAGVVLTR